MKHPDVIRLEGLFGKYPAARPLLLPADATPMPGQIWNIAGATAQYLIGEVILLGRTLDENGLAVVDVAPLVHDAAMAGPMDYILPENILCHHAVALLSLSFTLPQGKLGSCIGAIDETLWRDILAYYDRSQVNGLAPHEHHAPGYFDAQDARFRFHEMVARQITRLQADLYRWLDELENGGEWIVPEVPVIHAEDLFRNISRPACMAAAGENLPDSLEHFDLKMEIDGQPTCLTVRQSVKQGNYSLVVHGDRQGRCAKLLSASGQEIAAFVKGEARFEWNLEIGDALILADENGNPIAVINIQ